MEQYAEIEKQYRELFPESLSWEEVARKLNKNESHEHIIEFRTIFVNEYSDMLVKFHYQYNDFYTTGEGSVIIEQFFKLENDYFTSLASYITGDLKRALRYFKKYLDSTEDVNNIDWRWLATNILPFREAFPEFWECLRSFFKSQNADTKLIKLAEAVELFFNSSDYEIEIDKLSQCLVFDPENYLANEMIGLAYYYNGNWQNAISYLKDLNELYFLTTDELHYILGWSYGKLKEYNHEISCYEKCLEIFPSREYALNNLGYAYLKKKDYVKAEQIFRKCIDEKRDLDCAANNYVRVLLLLGKITEAKKFIETPPIKLSKHLLDKIKNYKPQKKNPAQSVISLEDTEAADMPLKKYCSKAKQYQFSTEKALEEELIARLEKGDEVFGLPLHVYNHNGDRYGRQYVLSGLGILDILAEDDDGNFYVIELKKDSGYRDAYSQIRAYLDWFEHHKKKKGRKVYGIICLNNPDAALIKKVQADEQVRLFEYSVTYTEYK